VINGALNVDMNETQTNLVPYSSINFTFTSFSPFIPLSMNIQDLTSNLFKNKIKWSAMESTLLHFYLSDIVSKDVNLTKYGCEGETCNLI
jgi:hypothetical protein